MELNPLIGQALDVASAQWNRHDAFLRDVDAYDLGLLREMFPAGKSEMTIIVRRTGQTITIVDHLLSGDGEDWAWVCVDSKDESVEGQEFFLSQLGRVDSYRYNSGIGDKNAGKAVITMIRRAYIDADEGDIYFEGPND